MIKMRGIKNTFKKNNKCSHVLSELHSEIGELTVNLNINLQFLEDYINTGDMKKAREEISEIKKSTDKSIKKIKDIFFKFRTSYIDEINDISYFYNYFKDIKESLGINIVFKNKIKNIVINRKVLLVLYKIIKESLFNIILHAKADTVEIEFMLNNMLLYCSIKDNGIGFNVDDALSSENRNIGINFSKRIAASVNGKIIIKTMANLGTKVEIIIPNAVENNK